MITCLIGTRAQLIKMAPVMRELEARGVAYKLVFSGQHKVTMLELLTEFGIATKPDFLYRGDEVTGIIQMGFWFLRVLPKLLMSRERFLPRSPGQPNVVLVHGDTFSTLLGAIAGRLCGMRVAHVESGLRSFKWFHPFPEELTRLAVFRLSHIAFCPNAWAIGNLAKYRLEKIDCGGNTLIDAVNYGLAQPPHPLAKIPDGDFGVVSLHRFENIFDRTRLIRILSLIDMAAAAMPVVFVLHPATRNKLEQFGLMARLRENPRYNLRDRMGYLPFLQLLHRARFVVTDGGSNQEELSYLGIPTLLMRQATERTEGLGKNVLIANYDGEIMHQFLAGLPAGVPEAAAIPAAKPSAAIVDALQRFAR